MRQEFKTCIACEKSFPNHRGYFFESKRCKRCKKWYLKEKKQKKQEYFVAHPEAWLIFTLERIIRIKEKKAQDKYERSRARGMIMGHSVEYWLKHPLPVNGWIIE